MKIPRRRFLHLAVGAAALPAVSRIARALGYPTRPVRFIVPFAAGGGLDYAARAIGAYLSHAFGQVVVENKPGAGGLIGTETAAKSPPDGYAVLFTTDSLASVPAVTNLNTDYIKELVPVIHLTSNPVIMAVHPSLGVNSVDELINAAQRQPGMGYGTGGVGTQQHFAGEWFAQIAGVKLDHFPYRGAGQAINDLIAGHVRVAFLGPTALIPHYKSGNVRLLAQSSETRSPNLPEVPTLQEAGFKGLVLETWYAAFVPLGTPPSSIARLNAEMDRALADPATAKSLLQTATEPVGGGAEQLARVARADSEKYERLARELNIKAN
jgi:tripartite-type tricarboxylate transporter receptor subunit TctC